MTLPGHHTELLDVLLSQSEINVNITNKNGWTPLMLAGWFRREEMFREASDEFTESRGSVLSCCRRLLRVPGIEVNRMNENGETAAHFTRGECLKVRIHQFY